MWRCRGRRQLASRRMGAMTAATHLWILVFLACSACTPLSDFSVHQCDSDADCEAYDGRIRRCEGSRCEEGCRDNQHCASVDPRAPICPSRGDDCVNLTSGGGECYVSTGYDETKMGELTADEMSLVGAFAPRLTSSEWLTMELAIDELSRSSIAAFQSRPLVLVLCDDASSAISGGIEHLIERLNVRTVLASLDDRSLSLATAIAKEQGGAVFLSPYGYATRAALEDNDRGQLWYLGSNHGAAVGVYLAVLERILDTLVTRGIGRDRARIAALVADTQEDAKLSVAVQQALTIAGKDADLLTREGRFLSLALPEIDNDARGDVFASLVRFAPDVVFTFASGAFTDSSRADRADIVLTLDPLLAESGKSPYYVFGPRNGSEVALTAAMRADGSLRSRSVVVRIDPKPIVPLVDDLTARFNQAFAALSPANGYLPVPSVYDGIYLLGMAHAAASSMREGESVDTIRAGFARVTSRTGDSLEVDPSLKTISMALESGVEFSLRGGSGDCVFTAEADRVGSREVYCWSERTHLELAATFDESLGVLLGVGNNCSGDLFVDAP